MSMDEQVLERVDALAAKLGVVGEHLWDVLVRQVYVDAALATFWVLAVCGVLAWTVRGFRNHRAKSGERDLIMDDGAMGWVLGLVLLAILAPIVLGYGIETIVTALTNPEYAALRKVLP